MKFTDNKILTGDHNKGTYIEPLSQRPPILVYVVISM